MAAESSRLPVALVRAESYDREEMDRQVERLFALTEADSFIAPGQKVLLKPNLLMKRRPEEATTTHPALVEAAARALQRRGVTDIVLADSPGGPYTRALLSGIYRTCGMEQAAQHTGISLNLDTATETVQRRENERAHSFSVIAPAVQADVIISLCKVKTHCMTVMSGGVKNLFGYVPGLQKPELHYRFTEKKDFAGMLVDLALTLPPALTIADGVVSMEGDGPSGGNPRETGFLAASRSPFQLDRVLCRMLGFPPEEVYTVEESIRRGLACRKLEEIPLLGDADLASPIPGFRHPRSRTVDFISYVPGPLKPAARVLRDRVLIPRPVIETRRCIGCGKCAESCPAKTISVTRGKAKIDGSRCIKCYCCHEMCPVKAIEIRRTRLFGF